MAVGCCVGSSEYFNDDCDVPFGSSRFSTLEIIQITSFFSQNRLFSYLFYSIIPLYRSFLPGNLSDPLLPVLVPPRRNNATISIPISRRRRKPK